MSVLFVSKMTEKISSLIAVLHLRGIQAMLCDDVISANELLNTANSYNSVMIGSDISLSEANVLIMQILAGQRRLPVIAMHALLCADHPNHRGSLSLCWNSAKACYAIDAADIMILMMHGQVSSHSISEHSRRLRIIVDIASAKVNALISQLRRQGQRNLPIRTG